MSRIPSINQKFQYCKSTKQSLYQLWKQCIKFQISISQSRKQQFFNRKFIQIVKTFLNDKLDVPCDQNMLPQFLDWVENQQPITNIEMLAVFDQKTALLWDCYLYLGQGKAIDKKIRDKYKVGVQQGQTPGQGQTDFRFK